LDSASRNAELAPAEPVEASAGSGGDSSGGASRQERTYRGRTAAKREQASRATLMQEGLGEWGIVAGVWTFDSGYGTILVVRSGDYVSLLPDPHLALRKQAVLFVEDQAGVRLDLLLAETP